MTLLRDELLSVFDRVSAGILATAKSSDLSAPVPACPDWQLRDLVAHVTWVARWAGTIIDESRPGPPSGEERKALHPDAGDPDLLGLCDSAFGRLAALLHSAAPVPSESPGCWTIWEVRDSRLFWIRRMAHEMAVHYVDACQAAGTPGATLSADEAADGIDEVMDGFGRRYTKHLHADAPLTLQISPSDHDRSWWCRISAGDPIFGAGPATEGADGVLRGDAYDLYLWLWNREPEGSIKVEGSSLAAGAWTNGAHF